MSASKIATTDESGGWALIRRLLAEQALGQWKRYAVSFALMGVAAGATALSAYLLGDVINSAYVDKNLNGIILLATLVALLFSLKAAATYFSQVMMARIGNAIIAQNQRQMVQALMRQNLEFFSDRHSSEFAARLTTGANAATAVIGHLTNAIGRDVTTLIALVVVMMMRDPILTVLTLVVMPPLMLLLRQLVRRIYSVIRSRFTGGARILETLQETIQGIRIVKAFTLEEQMQARIDVNIADLERESNKAARITSRASPLMEAFAGVGIALGLIYGGWRVIATGAKPGDFFSFLAAFMLAYEPAKRLARVNLELNAALVGVRILFEIIDTPATEPSDHHKPALAVTAAAVALRDVHFGYRSGETVLRGISFEAEPGQVTALVGPSGGGKSTIFNLLLRFYDIGAGSIAIDGQDIVGVSRASLRRQIAYVGQDVFLFHGSIRDNIAIGKAGASEAEIIAAAKAAHAHEFITALPAGYDTSVGERGMQISGGERQRVAIARALIKNAPIILLDEATAALDSESERLVQDAMDHLSRNRTTIVIAHRLHTIVHADRILVVENGAIAESGRHDELLRKGGRYAAFYRLQIREQRPEPATAVSA